MEAAAHWRCLQGLGCPARRGRLRLQPRSVDPEESTSAVRVMDEPYTDCREPALGDESTVRTLPFGSLRRKSHAQERVTLVLSVGLSV